MFALKLFKHEQLREKFFLPIASTTTAANLKFLLAGASLTEVPVVES
jgi:hypothetical protein